MLVPDGIAGGRIGAGDQTGGTPCVVFQQAALLIQRGQQRVPAVEKILTRVAVRFLPRPQPVAAVTGVHALVVGEMASIIKEHGASAIDKRVAFLVVLVLPGDQVPVIRLPADQPVHVVIHQWGSKGGHGGRRGGTQAERAQWVARWVERCVESIWQARCARRLWLPTAAGVVALVVGVVGGVPTHRGARTISHLHIIPDLPLETAAIVFDVGKVGAQRRRSGIGQCRRAPQDIGSIRGGDVIPQCL